MERSEGFSCTPAERRHSRRQMVAVLVTAAGYGLLLLLSDHLVDRLAGVAKIAVALMPLLGFLAMLFALIRFVTGLDEFQRQMILIAAAGAAMACVIVTMTVAFLVRAGLPTLDYGWVWPIYAACFGIALPIVRRRYR